MPASTHETSPLELYGHNLTLLAQQGAFAPLTGYDAVINRIFQILARNNKCNPAILTSDESLRWAMVAEVVRRMAIGEAPDPLSQRQVIALDYEALLANLPDEIFQLGTMRSRPFYQPSSEEGDTLATRLIALFTTLKQAEGSSLLYVNPFHHLFGGTLEKYPIDAATLLVPLLARRQIQLIGACTLEQYRQHIERDAAIQRRVQEVVVRKDEEIGQTV